MDTDESVVDYQIFPIYPLDEYPVWITRLYASMSPRDIRTMCWSTDDPPCYYTGFVKWASDKKALFLVLDGDNIAAMFAMTDVVSGEQCNIAGWSSPAYRGAETTIIFKIATEWLHDHMKMKRLYVFTPWPTARGLSLRAGYKEVATIPEYFQGTRSKALHILMSEKE